MEKLDFNIKVFVANYSKDKWSLHKPGNSNFACFDEKNKKNIQKAVQQGLIRDDLAQFQHLKKDLIIDVQANFSEDYVFNNYLLRVIDFTSFKDDPSSAWDHPIEQISIESSSELEDELTKLVKKYN